MHKTFFTFYCTVYTSCIWFTQILYYIVIKLLEPVWGLACDNSVTNLSYGAPSCIVDNTSSEHFQVTMYCRALSSARVDKNTSARHA
jgi:hypothetical protein